MSKRLERAVALLHKEVSQALPHLLMDKSYGLVTLSHIDLAPDLSQATAWVSLLGNTFTPEAIINYLNHQARTVQATISKSLYWRRTPRITFRLDQSSEHVLNIEKALQEIKADNPRPEAGAEAG